MKIIQASLNHYIKNKVFSENQEIQTQNTINFKGIPTASVPNSKLVEISKKILTPISLILKKYIKEPYRKYIGKPVEEKISDFFEFLVKTNAADNIIKWTEKHPNIKDKLFAHLIVLGSTILSGFYVIKTLNNDKLEEKKRKTLAINQASVYVLSTIMAYTFDIALGNKTKAIQTKFEKINKEQPSKAFPNIAKQKNGISRAKTIMIIDTIYRFFAPVAMTPLANAIGNKLNESK